MSDTLDSKYFQRIWKENPVKMELEVRGLFHRKEDLQMEYNNKRWASCYEEDEKQEMVNGDDFSLILGEECQRTWDDFYKMMDHERSIGDVNCPRAAYIALGLLRPYILRMPYKSARTTTETQQDLLQEAYLKITEVIPNFDRTKSSFKTYIMKWMQGIAREIRSDGISEYQKKQFGFKTLSIDALTSKNSIEEGMDVPIEFESVGDAIEDIVERRERSRSSELLHQIMEVDENGEFQSQKEMREAFTNAAFYHLFLGGIGNMSEEIKNEMELIIEERSGVQ